MTTFSNWSGNLQFTPQQICYPETLDEIVALVKQAHQQNGRIRLVGSGHSWMPLIETSDILVSLDQWQGVETVDHEAGTATIRAGTKLSRAGHELFTAGYALENMGDIDVQSIAGAFLTGTHGTGVNFSILASQLVGVTLVTGQGEVLEWDEVNHPDEMRAVRVSFGALGIVAKMAVRIQPTYKLQIQQYRMPLTQILAELETLKAENRNFEFFWFPHCDDAVVKRLNVTDRQPTKPAKVMTFLEDHALSWALKWSAKHVRSGRAINRNLMKLMNGENEGSVAPAHLAYPSTRELRFNEMEYNIPAAHWRECFAAIVAKYREPGFDLFFPVECRWVKGDDSWLSPAYQRESAYIAVHQVKGFAYQERFAQLEAIFRRFEGRPHWSKLNTMTRAEAWQHYPRMGAFATLRHELDPHKRFCNPYLEGILT